MAADATDMKQKLEGLRRALEGKGTLLIVMQTYPDPDALASAAALRALALHFGDTRVTITSAGIVGRAENRALARYLQLPYHRLDEVEPERFDAVAMVDTQPGTGANSLPPDTRVDVVIDHHPIRRKTRSAAFTDVRSRYGSCATILHEYLQLADMPIDAPLATALLYGIRSDTQDLGREASRADIQAIVALYPIANKRMLSRIQNASTPRSWFRMLDAALRDARVYDDRAIVACLGPIEIPDIVGEIADMALRDESATWTMCYGYFDDQMLLSIRCAEPQGDAGETMRKVVARKGTGGGHRAMAGGQIPLDGRSQAQRRQLEKTVARRFLKTLEIDMDKMQRLIAPQ